MRVLISAVPATGHIVPMLDVARALQVAGHQVRVATNSECHRLIVEGGLVSVDVGMSMSEMRAERLRRWPETHAQPARVWATRMWAQIMAPSTVAGLVGFVREWHPHVLVHDEGEYATPAVARLFGLPWVTHGWGSPLRPVEELVELETLTAELWGSLGLDVATYGGLYAHAVVNPCPRILQPVAPGVGVEWPLRSAGDIVDGGSVGADVYVGFGTVAQFADAPEELSAAVRSCVARGLRVVVTAQRAELRSELEAIDPAMVQAHEFVSLPRLLGSCRLVVTHAGAGTVLASLARGKPLVLVPRGAPSQHRMAESCDAAGVGRACASPANIDEAIGEVLGDASFARRAVDAAEQLRLMPAAASVVPLIERLVHNA